MENEEIIPEVIKHGEKPDKVVLNKSVTGCGCLVFIVIIFVILTMLGLLFKIINWMWDYVAWVAT